MIPTAPSVWALLAGVLVAGFLFVINPALKGGAFERTTWNTQPNPFPASTGPSTSAPVHRQSRAIRTAFQNLRGVDIGMLMVATRSAAEDGLRETRGRIDAPARAAHLRAVGGGHLDERSARPRQLVAETIHEAAPSGVEDATRKPAVGLHHVADLKLLNDDRAVALGIGGAESLDDVLPLSPDLPVQARDAELGLLPVLGSFLPSADDALGMGEPPHGAFVEARRLDDVAVAVGDDVHDAAIKGDDGFGAENGIGLLDLADDRGEPLVSVSANGAGLRCAFQQPMDDGAHVAELREAKHGAVKAPPLRVWLGESERVAALALPTRSAREALEATLPRLVKFDEELSTDVARNIGEPWESGAESGQLTDLVEGGEVDSIAARASKAQASLFQRQIPQEPQSALPPPKPSNLLFVRVDSEAEALVDEHDSKHSTATRAPIPSLEGGVSAQENRQ